MIVIEHLRRGARLHPERPAFVSGALALSYREITEMVDRIAGGLLAHGCAHGTPVAVISPNDPRAFACMLGILAAGAAWVPANARSAAASNADFLAAAGCEWLFWHGSLRDMVTEIRLRMPSRIRAVEIDGDPADAGSLVALQAAYRGSPVDVGPAKDHASGHGPLGRFPDRLVNVSRRP